MFHMTKFLKLMGGAIALVALFVGEAQAYVDPGSGSVIVTTILGVIAAIGYTFRKYFYKIRRKLFGVKSDEDADDD